jgi:hypothetical protein
VVHRRRSRRDPDGDLRAENHPAATIPGVSMSGCPSGGGGVREWEKEGQAAAALGFPVRQGWRRRVGGVVSPILHMSDQIISFKNTIF